MSSVLCFGLLILLLTIKVNSQSSCTTEKNPIKDKEETSCAQLGLTTIPLTQIPKDTEILILRFNALKSVATSTFKGMKNLVELDLSDNALSSFQVDFPLMLEELNLANNSLDAVPKLTQMSSLTHLVLSNNRISTIPATAFAGLKKLKSLELQKNEIDHLPKEVFKDVPLLTQLDLSYNKLWIIPDQLISSLDHLEKFYLTGNKLTEIPDGFFGDLVLAYVYLDKNPWNCNCALEYFKKWIEENVDSVYHIIDSDPVNNAESVVCLDGTPLLYYDTDQCHVKKRGDIDLNSVPKQPLTPVKVTKVEPTTKKSTSPRITTLMTTTEIAKTEKTTPVPTTEIAKTEETTPVLTTEIAKTEETTPVLTEIAKTEKTTPVLTTTVWQTPTMTIEIGGITTHITERMTTKGLASTWTTGALRTSERTTQTPSTTYQTSFRTSTEVGRTTEIATEVPTSTFHSTMKVDPSTSMTTRLIATASNVPTTSVMMPTQELTTIPEPQDTTPAIDSPVVAASTAWLAHAILKHCCLLHLLLYGSCLLLLLLQMMVSMMLLAWTYKFFYSHYQALIERLPGVRLIRYSLRSTVNKEEILLVRNDAIEPHFRDQSSNGVTRMLVLEGGSMDHEIRCTSVIL
ncbi:uncharacterized protein LOC142151094 [Mixophyes fleayi]|uniref:uncharacterized protein LOC142151094 n=1 Tax=Mixophyes fleayi TaxID=3061075 RepID=UPI003F4DB3FA